MSGRGEPGLSERREAEQADREQYHRPDRGDLRRVCAGPRAPARRGPRPPPHRVTRRRRSQRGRRRCGRGGGAGHHGPGNARQRTGGMMAALELATLPPRREHGGQFAAGCGSEGARQRTGAKTHPGPPRHCSVAGNRDGRRGRRQFRRDLPNSRRRASRFIAIPMSSSFEHTWTVVRVSFSQSSGGCSQCRFRGKRGRRNCRRMPRCCRRPARSEQMRHRWLEFGSGPVCAPSERAFATAAGTAAQTADRCATCEVA